MKKLKKSQNLYIRANIIQIDYQKDQIRIRKSTGLKYSGLAFQFVKKNYERYLIKGAEKQLKKEFQALEDEIVIQKLNAQENNKKIEKTPEPYSFKAIFEKVNNEKAFLKNSSVATYKSISKHLLNFLHSNNIYYVADFTREHCQLLLKYLLDNNKSSATINIYFILLNNVLTYAHENKIISDNPFYKPKMRQIAKKSEFKPFTLDEVKLLLKNADGDLKLYLFIAFFTGARIGEILALTWDNIDFLNNEISIHKTLALNGILDTPKTKSSFRTIDLLPILANKLKEYPQNNKTIIKSRRTKLNQEFQALLAKLNLAPRRLYDTRHTFASIMLSKGEEPIWVGCKMLGHKDLNETYRSYAKYLPREVRQRAKFLENEMF